MALITRENKGSELTIQEMDGNLLYLEALATPTTESRTWQDPVLNVTLTEPPTENEEGDRYIIAYTASGDWLGYDTYIAEYSSSTWEFTEPQDGFAALNLDDNTIYSFSGSNWATAPTQSNATVDKIDAHLKYGQYDTTYRRFGNRYSTNKRRNIYPAPSTNLNNIVENGEYIVTGTTNNPFTSSCYLRVQQYNDSYVLQEAYQLATTSSVSYVRKRVGTIWTGWSLVGSGGSTGASGLQEVLNVGSTASLSSSLIIDAQETVNDISLKTGAGASGDGWMASLDMTNTGYVTIKSYQSGSGDKYVQLYLSREENYLNLGVYDVDSYINNNIVVNTGGIQITSTNIDTADNVMLNLDVQNENNVKFTDNRGNSSGIEYGDDYSAGFNNRSLIDKGTTLQLIADANPTLQNVLDSGSDATLNNDMSINTINNQFKLNYILNNLNNNVGFNGTVYAIQLYSGSYYVIGNFTSYNSVSAPKIAKLSSLGVLDASFNAGLGFGSGTPNHMQIYNDKIYITGTFSNYSGSIVLKLVSINLDGTINTNFSSGNSVDQHIYTLYINNDKIYIGGNFSTYNDASSPYIAKLDLDGTLNTDFIMGDGFNSYISYITGNDEQYIFVCGNFTEYDGDSYNGIVKLNMENGGATIQFNPGTGVNNIIYSLTFSNDRIYIGGEFTTYNGNTANKIAALEFNGTFDSSFDPQGGPNGYLTTILYQHNKLYIGGQFTMYNGTLSRGLGRLNLDGTLDTTFNVGTGFYGGYEDEEPTQIITSLYNNIVIVGSFTVYNTKSINRLMELDQYGAYNFPINNGITTNSSSGLLEHNANYMALYNSRTLVDMAYVQTAISAAIYDFSCSIATI